ncbi:hypothetical protein N6L27_03465 [Leisingera sp. SS27]|uniref:hypothetical protein n=1 Tax=Leisingera sp. SS27 TaxID=2979462 RepID=UPI00232BE7BE|nr:hypothetical protein [Leisingera sp. SS27]MDC0657049.1 hypothetical protein [Leisingera sp. SS27]
MAVTGTKTVRDIVTAALRKARVIGPGDTPAAEDSDLAMDELNLMLKEWQNEPASVWTKAAGTLALTTAASYALSPVRPLEIESARFKRNGIETPMIEMTREEYDALPQKTTTGTPTQFYYDRQRENALFYVWPVLSAAAGETIEFTYQRELEDIASLNDVVDIPGEMWLTAVYGLAAQITETLGLNNPTLIARAQMLHDKAFAFDREGSVFFAGEGAE